jgi:hypothetical protein
MRITVTHDNINIRARGRSGPSDPLAKLPRFILAICRDDLMHFVNLALVRHDPARVDRHHTSRRAGKDHHLLALLGLLLIASRHPPTARVPRRHRATVAVAVAAEEFAAAFFEKEPSAAVTRRWGALTTGLLRHDEVASVRGAGVASWCKVLAIASTRSPQKRTASTSLELLSWQKGSVRAPSKSPKGAQRLQA